MTDACLDCKLATNCRNTTNLNCRWIKQPHLPATTGSDRPRSLPNSWRNRSKRRRGGEAVLPSRIGPRVSRRHLRANAGADAGGRRLPADARTQQSREARRRASRSICSRNTSAICRREKRALWDVVGRALCSEPVKQAFIRRLAPGLSKRFGARLRQDRHVSDPDPDPRHSRLHDHAAHRYGWKGITVQLYLPRDDRQHQHRHHLPRAARRRLAAEAAQMRFAPNTGYAFAVGDRHLAFGRSGAQPR